METENKSSIVESETAEQIAAEKEGKTESAAEMAVSNAVESSEKAAASAGETEGNSVREEEKAESMEDYSKELEASFRTVREGDVLTGSVIHVSEEGVTLDLDYYAPGLIKVSDLSRDPGFSVMNDVHPGDKLQGTVIKRDDGAGNILLSCVEASEVLGWDKLKKYLDEKTVLTVKVSEVVNKGVVAFLEGIRGFIPASHLSLEYVENLEEFVGKTLEVRVITVEKGKKKLVLSARDVLKEREAEQTNRKIAMLAPGTVLEGRVESLMPYGVFVDLGGGLSGLVHISQMSQKRIKTPSEVTAVGETVRVKVLNTNNGKVSLSMKAVSEDARPEPVDEKLAAQYSSGKSVGTSLGDLLKGLKL